ncbi:MAG: O-methyltransferase [Candidatus Acidiferrales bacterium]
MAITCTIDTPQVRSVLDRLFHNSEEIDDAALACANAQPNTGDARHRTRTEMLGEAYLPIHRQVGRLFYILLRANRCRTVVEFGTSFAVSTIYLAAAVRDNGGGKVITTEMHSGKVRQARENLREAGLLDLVDVREGDARETLRNIETPVNLLFLDGWKDLYLPVLKVVEPRFQPGSLVIADDLDITPDVHKPYLNYVRQPENGYVSQDVPMGDRFEVSLRLAGG